MKPMKTVILTLGMAALLSVASSQSRPTSPQARRGSAETALVGIKLYDTGVRVIQLYGTPNEVQGISAGSGGGGGGGAASSGGSAAAGKGGPSGGPGVPDINGNNMGGFALVGDPFNTGGASTTMMQARPGAIPNDDGFDEEAAARMAAGGDPMGAGGGGGRGTPAAPGGGGSGGGQSSRTTFTRWVYNRPHGRYGFILDNFNRVIQVEAIGLSDAKVKTKRGIGFGATFADIIKKYNAPDGYEISGQTIVVRYLVRDKVAFRLSRVQANKPQRVTGIVVAAGKQ